MVDDDVPLPPGAILEPDDEGHPGRVGGAPEPERPAWKTPGAIAVGAILAILLLIAVVLARPSGGGSDGQADEVSTTTSAARQTTTTAPAATSTTLPDAVLYQQLQGVIQQACDQAMETGEIPEVVFEDRWSTVSSADKLNAAIGSCVAARRQQQVDQAQPVDVDQVTKDPQTARGTVVLMVVKVTQYDANTGPCTFRAQWDTEARAATSMYRGTDAVFTSGNAVDGCPVLRSIDQNDVARVWVEVRGSSSVDGPDGATNVPTFYVLKSEVLQKL